jgi:hypothetical protein
MPEFEANDAMLARLDKTTDLLAQLVAKVPSPRLLRLKPAAAYLSISVGALRTLIQNGQIEIVKVSENGQHVPWLVDIKTLDQFIERRKQ